MKRLFNGNLARSTVLRCPRCGYDLRGVMGLWTDSCPLDGTCSECGLRWEWAELLSPTRRVPRWNIEMSPRPWSPRVFGRTLFMQLKPWIAWRELRMEHPVHKEKLIGYALWIFLLSFLLSYGAYVGRTTETLVTWKSAQAGGSVFAPSPEIQWLKLTFTPYSDQSTGTHSNAFGVYNFSSPDRYFRYWLEYESFAKNDNWASADWRWGILAPLVLIICWLIALAATPAWLRREKLRRIHYLRIGLYALSFIVFNRVATMLAFWVAATGLTDSPTAETIHTAQAVAFALTLLLGFAWWYHVCDDYLRLNQPRRVAIAVNLFGFTFPLGIFGSLNTIEEVRRWFF